MEIVRLEDVCTTTTSNLTLKELDKNNGAYPVYGASGLIKYIDFYNQDKEYIGIVKDGAGIGRVMLLPKNSSILGTMQYIFPNENIDIKYLYFNLIKMNLKKYYSGSTIPHIYFKDYKKEKIKLYSFEKQKKIAKILENISNIIEKKKQKLQEYELLSKCLFIKMFGDPLKENKNWQFKKILEIGTIISGSTPKTNFKEYWGGNNFWLTPAEMKDETFVINKTERTITDLGVKSCSLIKMPKGTVILSSRAPIGKVGILETEMYCNQGFKNIIPREEINSVYLYYIFKLKKDYLNSLGRGATFKEISKGIVEKIFIKVPPIELQNQFAERVKMIEKSKFELFRGVA